MPRRILLAGLLACAVGASLAGPAHADELLVNGGFESGDFSGWTQVTSNTDPMRGDGCQTDWSVLESDTICNLELTQINDPPEGVFAAYNSFDGGGPLTYVIEQSVVLDPGAITSATLSWRDSVGWDFSFGSPATEERIFLLEFFDFSGGPIGMAYELIVSPEGPTTDLIDWTMRSEDVTAMLQGFAGQTVRLRATVVVPENFSGPATLGLDDVSLDVVTVPPDVDCPNDSNPFGTSLVVKAGDEDEKVAAASVYTGPDIDGPMAAWAGCSGFAQLLEFEDNTIPLFFTAGNEPSEAANPAEGKPGPCNQLDQGDFESTIRAKGDEVCSLDFVIAITRGQGYFTSFVPDPDNFSNDINGRTIMTFPDVSQFNEQTKSIRVIVLSGQNPFGGPDFFHKIADVGVYVEVETAAMDRGKVQVLTRSGVGANASDEDFGKAEGTGAVTADLKGISLVNTVVGVPEPGVWLQLPTALLGLGLLARLRRRRRGAGRNGGG